MVVGYSISEESKIKTDGTHRAKEFSLNSYRLEEEQNARKAKRNERMAMLNGHVLNQGGSSDMCGEPLIPGDGQFNCKAIFLWYNIGQNLSTNPQVEYYPTGTEIHADRYIWDNYTINWTSELQGAVGSNGDLSSGSVKGIFNGDIRALTPEMMQKIENTIGLISNKWVQKYPATQGKIRPTLGIRSTSVARCNCCFSNPALYNNHMRSIHGIETELEGPSTASSAPPSHQEAAAAGNYNERFLRVLKGTSQKWLCLDPLKSGPGRRQMREAWDALLDALNSTGNYNNLSTYQETENHRPILHRLKEMIHGNDMEDFKAAYHRISEKNIDIIHQVKMDNVLQALGTIVDKNCGETNIKKFMDSIVQGGRPVSKQAQGIRQQIGDIITEEFRIKTTHKCSCSECRCGGKESEIEVPADQVKDFLTIFILLSRQPKDMNPSYQGKIRELLKPFLNTMVNFSMQDFLNKIEAYEDSKNLFTAKPKVQANRTSGALGTHQHQTHKNSWAARPAPDPQVIQKLRNDVQDAGKKWEVNDWKTHEVACTQATARTSENRMCYWCIKSECLRTRSDFYRNKGKDFQMQTKGVDYLEWRIKMDKSTKNMCPNFTALNSRLPGGAKVGKAIIAEVKINQTTQAIQEPAVRTLHCHIACVQHKINDPCSQPIDCENNRKNGVKCPVKEVGEHHDCDICKNYSEGELIEANRTRAMDNKHPLSGIYWGMETMELVCVAPRDTVISGNTARQMSVTVNEVEVQEDFNSTSESIMDDDELYEQEDSEFEGYNSDSDTDPDQQDSVDQELLDYISRPLSPTQPKTESETESITDQPIKKPKKSTEWVPTLFLDEATINNMEGRTRIAFQMPQAPLAPVPVTPMAPVPIAHQATAHTITPGSTTPQATAPVMTPVSTAPQATTPPKKQPKNHSWSEVSTTTKTGDKIKVSYSRDETVEQANGDNHITTESYVKHYSEEEYNKKKGNKKFWKRFWNQLNLLVTILSMVGILYIASSGHQQTGCTADNKYIKLSQPENIQITRPVMYQNDAWGSSLCTFRPELALNEAGKGQSGWQTMALTRDYQSLGLDHQNDTLL